MLTGEPQVGHRSPGLMATNAVAALAADRAIGEPFVQALWDQPIPTGQYRYYDGLLVMLGLLQVSGNFRIYEPGSAPTGQVFPTPKPEVDGKFAPPLGKALLLVGPDKESADAYFEATVTAPGGVAVIIDSQLNGMEDLDDLAGRYPNSILSIGVDLGDSPDTISAEQIDTLLDTLNSYNRPVFLRLAFGSEDAPDAFVSVWETFHERMQAKGAALGDSNGSLNLALVWESASCEQSDLARWYPGDQSVDWIGANYECPHQAIQFAREHFIPAMLTAASPGTDEWFAPFFQFVVDHNDVVRAVTYVNEGESRLSNGDIVKTWKDESRGSFWLRGGPDLFGALSQ